MALRPVVLDGADFFKPETIDKADAIIRQIKSATGKDLMVETYPTIPERMHPDYRAERAGRLFPRLGERAGRRAAGGRRAHPD